VLSAKRNHVRATLQVEQAIAIVLLGILGALALAPLGDSMSQAIASGGGQSAQLATVANAPVAVAPPAQGPSAQAGIGSSIARLVGSARNAPVDAARHIPHTLAEAGIPAPIREWMDLEQTLLTRRVGIGHIDTPRGHRLTPESRAIFAVESYWLPADEAHVFEADALPPELAAQFLRTRDGTREVRYLVHPESRGAIERSGVLHHATPGEPLLATATSSSRTLLTWDPANPAVPFFAKLSLDQKLYGLDRMINGAQVARSLGVERILARSTDLPRSFRWLPEVLGVMPHGPERGGMILRTIPADLLSGDRRLIPLFALGPAGPAGEAPILARMIARSGKSAPDFVRDRIIRPFVREYVALLDDHGIVSEPHAQNVLLEVGRDGMPTGRFVHRDLGGFVPDLERRAAKGLHDEGLPVVGDLAYDYFQREASARSTNITHYFGKRFLWTLDVEMSDAQRSGHLPGADLAPAEFRELYIHEMEAYGEARRMKAARAARN
jgi:hypothetical protein